MTTPWPMVGLGEVLVQYREYIEAPEPRLYPKLSVKLYGKGVVLDEPADGALLKMKRHQVARAGQVVLSEIWGKKGAIGIVPPAGEGALCTSHFFLFDIDTARLDAGYLQAIFTANYLQEQLDAEAKGTTGYAAVRPRNLLAAVIPLPPLAEQRRIVARIEALSAKIEEARGLRRETMEEAEAVMASAKGRIFSPSYLGHWQRTPLGALAKIAAGVTLGRRLTGTTVSLPYLRVANVQDGFIDIRHVKLVDVLPEEVTKWSLVAGDILLTEGGDWDKLGRGAVWQGEIEGCIHQNHVFRIRVDADEISPRYLSMLIGSPCGKAYFRNASKQTTNLASINQRQLRAFPVFMPPISEQHRIVAYLDSLQARVDALKRLQAESAAELDALLPSVLDGAFRGALSSRYNRS